MPKQAMVVLPDALKYRSPLMGAAALRWLNTRKTWVMDCRVYTNTAGEILVRVDQANGLGDVLTEPYWYVLTCDLLDNWTMQRIAYHGDASALVERTLNDPPMLKHIGGADAYSAIWRLLYSLNTLWPRSNWPRRTVRFHCFEPMGVFDPMEGVLNHYDSTGRAVRDERLKVRAQKG